MVYLYTIVQEPDPSGSPGDMAFYMPACSCFIFIVVLSPCIVTTSSDIGTSVVTTTAHLTSIHDNITPNISASIISDHPMTTLCNSVISIHSSTVLPVASVSIPKALTKLYDENYRLLNKEDLLTKAVEVFRSISFSDSECKAIEAPEKLWKMEYTMKRQYYYFALSQHLCFKDGTLLESLCIRLLRPMQGFVRYRCNQMGHQQWRQSSPAVYRRNVCLPSKLSLWAMWTCGKPTISVPWY